MGNAPNHDEARRPRRTICSVACLLMLFVIVLHLLERTWRKDAEYGMTMRVVDALQGRENEFSTDVYRDDDVRFKALGRGHGNVALRLQGVDFNDANASFGVMKLWYRMVYAIYPRKVYLAPLGTLLNSATDLRTAPPLPDDAALRELGVTTEWSLRIQPEGLIESERAITVINGGAR